MSAPPAGNVPVDGTVAPGESDLNAPPTAVPQSAPAGDGRPEPRPDTKPAGPGVIGRDPLRADDDPAPGPNLPGKGGLKQ